MYTWALTPYKGSRVLETLFQSWTRLSYSLLQYYTLLWRGYCWSEQACLTVCTSSHSCYCYSSDTPIMAYSEVFNNFINSFEDADTLEGWAREYGHFDLPIVQQRLSYIRNYPTIPTRVSTYYILQCIIIVSPGQSRGILWFSLRCAAAASASAASTASAASAEISCVRSTGHTYLWIIFIFGMDIG